MFKKNHLIYLKKNLRYFKKYRVKMFLYLLLNLFLSVTGAIIPIFSAMLISGISTGIMNKVLMYGFIVFSAEMVVELISLITDKLFFIFYGRVVLDIRNDICKNVLDLEIEELENNGSGVFTRRISLDANNLGYVFVAFNSSITSIITNVGVLILIFVINIYVGIFYLICLLIIFLNHRVRIKRRTIMNKEYNEIEDKNTSLINELIKGAKDIKLLNINDSFLNKNSIELEKSYNKKYNLDVNNRYHWLIDGLIKKSIKFIFILLGIYLVDKKILNTANFLILYMYQDRLFNLVNSFSEMASSLKDFDVSAERFFEVVDGLKFKKERFGEKDINKIEGYIEFKNVDFGYKENNLVLKNISFKISPNENIAIVGKSGSGKTTIFNLIANLYKVNTGEILLDNINIKDLSRDSLRNNVSIIPQFPYIFDLTIKENLKLVNKNISNDEIIEICKVACIHDDILKMPKQYDTLIGEGGVTLSGGQRQRLAIARALVKKSEIILFDESTSSLDNETQYKVQQAIKNISKNYTILIIAHRLNTVKNCDRIIIIDDGEIVDVGTHLELIENCKLYKKLYEEEFID